MVLTQKQKFLLENIQVLADRAKRLKMIVKQRMVKGTYNITEEKRLLNKIRAAKKNVADAEFI